MGYFRYEKDIREKILEKYLSGVALHKLAVDYSIPPATIRYWVLRSNAPNHKYIKEQREEIKRLRTATIILHKKCYNLTRLLYGIVYCICILAMVGVCIYLW